MNETLPLGRKAYGAIPHLPGSRTGPADRHLAPELARLLVETAPADAVVIVEEKLDGSCVAAARVGDRVLALGRGGDLAERSRNPARRMFARWVEREEARLLAILADGERVVGEWLALAHGTRYRLPHEPFVAFDLMNGSRRATRDELAARASSVDDGVRYSAPSIEVIWAETQFPGLRARTIATVEHADIDVQIDVGFGDPRAVPDPEVAIEGTRTPMRVVAPETLYAWKLHGLFERGHGQWRPKDLFDLLLLGRRDDLDEAMLPECVRVAFASRGDSLAITDRFLHGPWGRSAASARKWRSYRRRRGNDHAPEALDPVLDEVRERARPRIEAARR